MSRGCRVTSPSPGCHPWPRCQGRSGFVPPGDPGREGTDLDEAKALEKAVGVHEETP